MKKLKFYWHIHHDILVEPLTEPLKNRIRYIKENKPENEIELRLKLLKPVKGKLPKRVIKAEEAWNKAEEAYDKAEEAWNKAGEAYIKVWEAYYKAGEAYCKAREAWNKAGEAWNKAGEAYYKAGEAYYKTLTMKSVLALHKKECGCNWNGESIFNK